MDVRPAESDDRERIEAIANDSFRTSYSLSPQQIAAILKTEFNDETLTERLEDPDTVVFVADGTTDGDETVLGFVDVTMGPEATMRWLHVDPEARGGGVATALIDRVRDEARTPITARVLDAAVEGGEFLNEFGLGPDGNDEVAIGGEEFGVTVFTEGESTDTSNDPAVSVPESVTVDGAERSVDREGTIPGREAPFFSIYSDAAEDDPYGYLCSQCGSTDVSADGLDRLECGDCGNVHLANEWDDAYL